MNISIITIAYNGYGKFIPTWLESLTNQTIKPSEAVIVLSENHGMIDILPEEIDGIKIKTIHEPKRLSMGLLRNIAIKNATSEWILNLDVDDVLTPNGIEEMQKYIHADAISLKYYKDFKEKRQLYDSKVPIVSQPKKWKELCIGAFGYIAHKKEFNGTIPLCVDSDFPNYPFLIQIGEMGMRFATTENPCAIYKKEKTGHSQELTDTEREVAFNTIKYYAYYYQKK